MENDGESNPTSKEKKNQITKSQSKSSQNSKIEDNNPSENTEDTESVNVPELKDQIKIKIDLIAKLTICCYLNQLKKKIRILYRQPRMKNS